MTLPELAARTLDHGDDSVIGEMALEGLDEYLAWQPEPRHSKPFAHIWFVWLIVGGITTLLGLLYFNLVFLVLHLVENGAASVDGMGDSVIHR